MDNEPSDNKNIIDCPQCNIKNPIESDICYNCGAPLHVEPTQAKSRSWTPVVLFIVFVVVAGLIYFYSKFDGTGSPPSPKRSASVEETIPKREPAPLPEVRLNLLMSRLVCCVSMILPEIQY
jgi:hypothetical protein